MARVEMEKAKGTADMQAQLAQSAVGIEHQGQRGAGPQGAGRGEAAFVELTGKAEATKIQAIGLAEAKATEALGLARAAGYEAQTEAIGQTATALVAVANAVADGHITVVPEVLVTGRRRCARRPRGDAHAHARHRQRWPQGDRQDRTDRRAAHCGAAHRPRTDRLTASVRRTEESRTVEVGVVDDDLDERAGVDFVDVQQLPDQVPVSVECFGLARRCPPSRRRVRYPDGPRARRRSRSRPGDPSTD